VCAFLAASFFGSFFYSGSIFFGLGAGLLSYVVALVSAFLMMLVADALAPTFGGTKNQVAAMKLVAFSLTAGFVAGVFVLIPFLGALLRLLAACYGIYLFYLGVPVLMKVSQEKAAGYTAAVVIVVFVVGAVIGSIFMAVGGMGMLFAGRTHHPAAFSINTPNGEITVDTAAIDAANKRMEAARAKMEAAQKTGDPASAGAAASEMLGALTGAGGTPIPPADLKAQLPETWGNLKRESFETQGGTAIGIASSSAKATYTGPDNQHAEASLTDLGGLGGLASVATWANVTVDKETPDGIEKTYKDGGRTIHEQYRKDGSHSDYTVILKNGVIFESHGDHIDGATLKSMASAINLDAIEAMKRPAKT
jgi:hypothetical protein